MTLGDIALWAEILGSLAVLGAIIFGYIQVRQFRTQRRDLAAIELVRSFQDERFTHGYKIISDLPEDLSADQLRAMGGEYEEVALGIAMKYETVGLLVHRGIIPLEIVEDLVGGAGALIWNRLRLWIYALREERGHQTLLEWFEWLAIQLEKQRGDNDVPAYERYRDWTPPQ